MSYIKDFIKDCIQRAFEEKSDFLVIAQEEAANKTIDLLNDLKSIDIRTAPLYSVLEKT